MSSPKYRIPGLDELRNHTFQKLGVRPCLFQARDCLTQLENKKDCVTIARTGLGKTLTFFMPLLFNGKGIKIIVTALNVLGEQNVAELTRLGIPSINITKKTATDRAFKVRVKLMKEARRLYLTGH
jgi:superfamily II DNA helicase RecQ